MPKVIVAALLALVAAGCSSAQKSSKTATSAGTNSFLSSSKQVRTDLTQTEADLDKLESQVKLSK